MSAHTRVRSGTARARTKTRAMAIAGDVRRQSRKLICSCADYLVDLTATDRQQRWGCVCDNLHPYAPEAHHPKPPEQIRGQVGALLPTSWTRFLKGGITLPPAVPTARQTPSSRPRLRGPRDDYPARTHTTSGQRWDLGGSSTLRTEPHHRIHVSAS